MWYLILMSYPFTYAFLYFLTRLESNHKKFKLTPLPRFLILFMFIFPVFNCIIATVMFMFRYLELGDKDDVRRDWDRKSLNNMIFFRDESYKNER